MFNNLEVTANGLKFENPFILASAPPTATSDLICKAFDLGWGGAIIKTVKDDDVLNSNVSPRFDVLRHKNKIIGFENIEMLSEKPLNYWLTAIKEIKEKYPTKILIASVMGSAGVDSWQSISKKVAEAGADAIELNFSCPNGVTAQGLGLAIGQDNTIIELITKAVKDVVNIPVIIKLTPNVTSISSATKAAINGGADGICAINTVWGLIGVDIESLTPLPNVHGQSTFGGLSGAIVKPIGLRCVAEIAQTIRKNNKENSIPIYAVGGISNWKDAVEYIAVGASTVQICTEVMLSGADIITKLLKGLSDYLTRKGFNSIEDFRGVALSKLVSHNELNRDVKVIAEINYNFCESCRSCIKICHDSAANAIYYDNNKVIIDKNLCIGCSLCTFICPTKALSLIEK